MESFPLRLAYICAEGSNALSQRRGHKREAVSQLEKSLQASPTEAVAALTTEER